MDTGLNFEKIREEIDKQPWEQSDEPDREERRLFLGTVFALTPSGKFYTPRACSNVTEKEAEVDQKWYDAVSEGLEKVGLYLQHGEGDPCDLLAGEIRDREESK